MSDTPETDKQAIGVIGFYSCATVPADLARRLERERDEARIQFRSVEALAMALVKTINELKEERADHKATIESLGDDACRESCRDKEAADRAGGNPWSNI